MEETSKIEVLMYKMVDKDLYFAGNKVAKFEDELDGEIICKIMNNYQASFRREPDLSILASS